MNPQLLVLASLAAATPLSLLQRLQSGIAPRDDGSLVSWDYLFPRAKKASTTDGLDSESSSESSSSSKPSPLGFVNQFLAYQEDEIDEDDSEAEDLKKVEFALKNLKNFRIIVEYPDEKLITLKQGNQSHRLLVAPHGKDAYFNLVNSTLTSLNGTRILPDISGWITGDNVTYPNTTNLTTNSTKNSTKGKASAEPTSLSGLLPLNTTNSTSKINSTQLALNASGWHIIDRKLYYQNYTSWNACPDAKNTTFTISDRKCKRGEKVKLRILY